jgi:hypothetical protein
MLGLRFVRLLEGDRRLERLPGRSKSSHRFIAPQLDQLPAMRFHLPARHRRKFRCYPGAGFIAMLLGEAGVAANVGDQKGASLGCPRGSPGAISISYR